MVLLEKVTHSLGFDFARIALVEILAIQIPNSIENLLTLDVGAADWKFLGTEYMFRLGIKLLIAF